MRGTRLDALLEFIDNLPFRKARVRGLSKDSTVFIVYPYGLTGNAPEGSLCVSWEVTGQENDRASIADFPQIRPKNLEPGEVVVSNYLTKSEVRFKANGDINITSEGNLNLIVDGNFTAAAESFAFTSTGLMTHNGENIGDTHIHSQANDSNGDSEADTGFPHS